MAEPGVVRHEEPDEHIEPLFYPANKLELTAPFRWLKQGWQDIRTAPAQSLAYGSLLVLTGWLLTWLAWQGGNTLALFTLVTGLILVGPVLAFGLYSISRQIEMGLKPRIGFCVRESKTHLRNELLFALVLLIILLVWARAASMVHIFFPISDDLGLLEWAQFLAVGSAVGSIFAGIVFTASAFSLPMMLDRRDHRRADQRQCGVQQQRADADLGRLDRRPGGARPVDRLLRLRRGAAVDRSRHLARL